MNPALNQALLEARSGERRLAAEQRRRVTGADVAHHRPSRRSPRRQRSGARARAQLLVLRRALVAFHKDTARASKALFRPPAQRES
jgi:hypothetical protein